MKSKLKTTIITALLLMASVSSLVAQDKYEYAVVKYVPTISKNYIIYFSTSTSYATNKGAVEEGYSFDNFVPVLKFLDELVEKGWEVTTTDITTANHLIYHLRKKKN
jgi:hypothetical protein